MLVKNNIRVLHCAGSMLGGGIETWLRNLIKAKPDDVDFDFLLNIKNPVDEILSREYGVNFYYYSQRHFLLRKMEEYHFIRAERVLRDLLSKNRYDVVHTHSNRNCGDNMKTSFDLRVPVRIIHCHGFSLNSRVNSIYSFMKKYSNRINQPKAIRFANGYISCSDPSGSAYFGRDIIGNNEIYKTVYCGIPLIDFISAASQKRSEVRQELGIPEDAKVVCHIGNQNYLKNHLFLLKVFKEIYLADPKFFLLMIGTGSQLQEVKDFVSDNRIEDRVVLAGIRNDIPSLLIHSADSFLFPSISEGLPLSCLEALAAGLQIVCSTGAASPDLLKYFNERMNVLSLDDPIEKWQEKVIESISARLVPETAFDLFKKTPFTVEASAVSLREFYFSLLNRNVH